jgi:hypothetical protein
MPAQLQRCVYVKSYLDLCAYNFFIFLKPDTQDASGSASTVYKQRSFCMTNIERGKYM